MDRGSENSRSGLLMHPTLTLYTATAMDSGPVARGKKNAYLQSPNQSGHNGYTPCSDKLFGATKIDYALH